MSRYALFCLQVALQTNLCIHQNSNSTHLVFILKKMAILNTIQYISISNSLLLPAVMRTSFDWLYGNKIPAFLYRHNLFRIVRHMLQLIGTRNRIYLQHSINIPKNSRKGFCTLAFVTFSMRILVNFANFSFCIDF